MPLSPSSGLSSRFSSYSSYSSYPSYSRVSSSSGSSSSYLSRGESKDRSSSYGGSSVGSSYYPSYYKRQSGLPPRPSYSSSSTTSEGYRSSRSSRKSSPPRERTYKSSTSYDSTEPKEHRYSFKSRDSSSSRDSGYGSSYLSGRYTTYELPNGVSPRKRTDSISSVTNEEEKREEKSKFVSRTKSYEAPKDPFEERLNERRRRLGLSPVRVTNSRSPTRPKYSDYKSSIDSVNTSGISGGATVPSYKSSYKSFSSYPTETSRAANDDTETLSTSYTKRESPDRSTLLKEIQKERIRTESNSSDTIDGERNKNVLESPVLSKRPSSPGTKRESSPEPEDVKTTPKLTFRPKKSTLPLNRYSWSPRSDTSLTIPTIRIEPEPAPAERPEPESIRSVREPVGSLALRARDRRDRVKDRIAARLACELDGVQTSHSPSTTFSLDSSNQFSEQNGLVGLRNIGNTCFLNSVTQCLSNTPPLTDYLVKEGVSSSDINTTISPMKGDLIKAFANLLNELWRGSPTEVRSPINTSAFKAQIQRFAPQFIGYQQHDAQEFLRKLLEGLHEDVNRVSSRCKAILADIDEDLDDRQKAIEAWKRYLRFDDSRIVDMFVGQLMSCLRCSHCGYRSVTFDPFWDLSLPIPPHTRQVKIQQCLELFTKEEVLDGDERPTCSKCKERRRMTKCFSIQRFPKVLVLHLKRFSPLERWRGKLTCTVDFPLDGLDLSSYASGVGSNGSGAYKLLGMANHSGTALSGHYTAYCKHPYKSQWYEFNDSRVSNIASHRVVSPEAYLLFYELKY